MRTLLITSGDPAGIGLDICIQCAANKMMPPHTRCVILADSQLFAARAQLLNITLDVPVIYSLTERMSNVSLAVWHTQCPVVVKAGCPDIASAPYIMAQLKQAVAACQQSMADAIITTPVNKKLLRAYNFFGHTEWLAGAFGVPMTLMTFINPQLKVALATTHIPLSQVPSALSKNKLLAIFDLLATAARHYFKQSRIKILLLGLNPHAGEDGLLGTEEITLLMPAVKAARAKDVDVIGPIPADSFFLHPEFTREAFVVALYHDQILPLLKYSDFKATVNVTLGLPVVRTSVDHGTAYQLAGTGEAECVNLQNALTLAQKLTL